jgi:hypothetical protein
MKFPSGEFTGAELIAINKNLQAQTVRIFLNSDAIRGLIQNGEIAKNERQSIFLFKTGGCQQMLAYGKNVKP